MRRLAAPLAAVAAVVTLVACGSQDASRAQGGAVTRTGANPGAIYLSHDRPPTALRDYARPGGTVIVDIDQSDEIPRRLDRFRRAGAEVLTYVDLVEATTGGNPHWHERSILQGRGRGAYRGQRDVPHDLWWRGADGRRRSNYPRSYMLDIRKGSAFADRAVRWAGGYLRRCHCDGLFLDVLGARLYSRAWAQMSARERAQWSEGSFDLARRLRARLDPDGDGRPLLVANNTQVKTDSAWDGWPVDGNPALNGFVFERPGRDLAAAYDAHVSGGRWHAPRRMMVIARRTPQDCGFWDARATVDVVLCARAGYGRVDAPQTPFRAHR